MVFKSKNTKVFRCWQSIDQWNDTNYQCQHWPLAPLISYSHYVLRPLIARSVSLSSDHIKNGAPPLSVIVMTMFPTVLRVGWAHRGVVSKRALAGCGRSSREDVSLRRLADSCRATAEGCLQSDWSTSSQPFSPKCAAEKTQHHLNIRLQRIITLDWLCAEFAGFFKILNYLDRVLIYLYKTFHGDVWFLKFGW